MLRFTMCFGVIVVPGIKANRKSIRAPVAPQHVQGLLTRILNNEQIPFLVWDVSSTGLGLWCTSELAKGEKVRLTVGAPYPLLIDAEIMWVSQETMGEGYRCGLEVSKEGLTKLLALYEHFKKLMEENVSDSES